jgi:hypothetical protein
VAFLLGLAGVVSLAFADGGYDVVFRNQVGILVWWMLGLGAALGLVPLLRPSRLAIAGAAAFLLFLAWMAFGLIWTESVDSTLADVGRVSVIAGFFLAAMALRPDAGKPRVIDGVAAAICVVCLAAVASRIFPGLFSDSGETSLLVSASEGRLSFPVDYWNGLAALAAVGIAPVLAVATEPGNRIWRSVAAGFLPILALTVFLTYSRTGIIATLLAVVVFCALATRFVQRAVTLLVAVVASATLIAFVGPRSEISDGVVNAGLTGVADGTVMIAVPLAALLVGGIQWWLTRMDGRLAAISWRPERRTLLIAGAVGAAVLLIAFLAGSGPSRVSDAWHEFESPGEVQDSGAGRLSSFGGNNRVQFWRAAIDQFDSEPIHGRGSGTFELWSNRSETTEGFVRDAHSWYLETLGELGMVGGILLVAIVLIVLLGGGAVVLRAKPDQRARLAAALAGCVAFFVTAALDWTWELAVVPVAAFLLAGTLLMTPRAPAGSVLRPPRTQLPISLRIGLPAVAVVAVAAIWLPFSQSYLLEQSQSAAGRGDLEAAYSDASSAADLPLSGMGPILQQALLLRDNGEFERALDKAEEATDLEPTNWRPWFVRSYLEYRLGREPASRASFETALSLNPHSSLLSQGFPGDK